MPKSDKNPLSARVTILWLLLFCALLLGSARLLMTAKPGLFLSKGSSGTPEQREALQFCVYSVLFDFGIRVDWISGNNYYKKVRVPRDLAIDEPYAALVARILELGGILLRADSNPDGDRKVIEVGLGSDSLFQVILFRDQQISRIAGKIAIVIDDFGYAFDDDVKAFLYLDNHINVSILPGLRYSSEISQLARERGLEVLLHMPMEPANGRYTPDEYMLTTALEPPAIRDRFKKAIATVPQATGVNNHMGSLATVDAPLLEILMEELDKANLFFLDSMTNPDSQAFRVARKKNVLSCINNTFLDSIKEAPFIRQQLHLLGEMASRNGHAVGIGHPDELTLEVLREEMPKLEKLGFKFVPASELVK